MEINFMSGLNGHITKYQKEKEKKIQLHCLRKFKIGFCFVQEGLPD